MIPLPIVSDQSLPLRVACVSLCLWAGAALAHDDHPGSPVSIVVTQTQSVQHGLQMTLSVANRGHIPVQINALQSDLGPVAGLDLPHFVLAGQTEHLQTTVTLTESAGAVPGIFTLMVDMAELGIGPVLVMPDV